MRYFLFIISLLIIFLFLLTAPPTIYLGDSGEVASAAFNLGIGHPPGYPLYILMGKIALMLPIGDEAFRINFLCILLSCFVFIILFLTLKKFINMLYKNESNSLYILTALVSLIFVLSCDFWNVAINVKGGIYVFNVLIVLLAIYSVIKYYFDHDKKHLYLSLYLMGFMPVTHQTSLFIMIFLFFTVLYIAIKRKEKKFLAAFLFFLYSLITSWLYLFIRYKTAANVWAGIDSIELLLSFIFRKVYLNQNDPLFTLNSGLSKFILFLKNYFDNFNILLFFVIYGFVVIYQKNKTFFYISSFIYFTNLFLIIFFTYNGNSPEFYYVNKPFYIVNIIFSSFFLLAGINSFLIFTKNKFKIRQFIILSVFVIPFVCIIFNGFKNNNHSRKFLAYDHAMNILKTIDSNDKVFGKADIYIFNVQYIQQVKKLHIKKTIYDQNGNVLDVSIYNDARKNGVLNIDKQEEVEMKLYSENKNNIYFMDMTSYPKYNLMTKPYGILHKLTQAPAIFDNNEKLMSIYSIRDFFNCSNNDYFYRYVIGRYLVRKAEYAAISSVMNKFEFYKNYSEKIGYDITNIIKNIASIYFHNLKDLRNTMKYLEKAIVLDNYDFPTLNLIIAIYHELGMREKEIYWLRFYYEKEWRKNIKENMLRQINYISSIK